MDKEKQIEILRKKVSQRRGGEFIGYNDPELAHLIEHQPHPGEKTAGSSGRHPGFLFGGVIYPDAAIARRTYQPLIGEVDKPIKN